jgi:hypothetical protein
VGPGDDTLICMLRKLDVRLFEEGAGRCFIVGKAIEALLDDPPALRRACALSSNYG